MDHGRRAIRAGVAAGILLLLALAVRRTTVAEATVLGSAAI